MPFFNRRVVVTGMGVVTPIGIGIHAFEKSLRSGKTGEGDITRFDTTNFPVKRAFEVKNFDAKKHHTHVLDPFIQYTIAATKEALETASFDVESVDPYSIGLAVSSSKGGVHTLERFEERFKKNPSAILGARIYTNTVPNFAAQWIARRWKIQGPAKCYVTACATGTSAISEGARMISEGTVDYCLAGASDASIVPLMLAGYHKMKVLSKTKMRPFDKKRDGFMVGEGAGIVFLETLESAQKRNAKIYGEIKATATGQDTVDAMSFDEQGDALATALQTLVKRSEWASYESVDYINLHGTATRDGDRYETGQVKKAFGPAANKIAMSSTKSMTGHMLGASGAVEIIACLLSMNGNFIPPTASLENACGECDLNYVPKDAKVSEVKNAISFSAGFGGHVASISLERGPE